MKKTWIVIAILGLLVAPVVAQESGRAQFEAVKEGVRTAQHARTGHGYIQYLPTALGATHRAARPARGAAAALIMPCPSDQETCPSLALSESPGLTITVNVYESPIGPGYELVGEYMDASGQRWQAVENYGPEVWRGHDFQAVR